MVNCQTSVDVERNNEQQQQVGAVSSRQYVLPVRSSRVKELETRAKHNISTRHNQHKGDTRAATEHKEMMNNAAKLVSVCGLTSCVWF